MKSRRANGATILINPQLHFSRVSDTSPSSQTFADYVDCNLLANLKCSVFLATDWPSSKTLWPDATLKLQKLGTPRNWKRAISRVPWHLNARLGLEIPKTMAVSTGHLVSCEAQRARPFLLADCKKAPHGKLSGDVSRRPRTWTY